MDKLSTTILELLHEGRKDDLIRSWETRIPWGMLPESHYLADPANRESYIRDKVKDALTFRLGEWVSLYTTAAQVSFLSAMIHDRISMDELRKIRDIVEKIIGKKYKNLFQRGYYAGIFNHLDGLKDDLESGKITVDDLSLVDLSSIDDSEEFLDTLRDVGSNIARLSPRVITNLSDDVEIIKKYSNGFAWMSLNTNTCEQEAASGKHCGNARDQQNERWHPDDRLYSLRRPVKYRGGTGWKTVLTVVLNNGMVREIEGVANTSPKEEFHPYILDFFHEFAEGIGELPVRGFQYHDLDDEVWDRLKRKGFIVDPEWTPDPFEDEFDAYDEENPNFIHFSRLVGDGEFNESVEILNDRDLFCKYDHNTGYYILTNLSFSSSRRDQWSFEDMETMGLFFAPYKQTEALFSKFFSFLHGSNSEFRELLSKKFPSMFRANYLFSAITKRDSEKDKVFFSWMDRNLRKFYIDRTNVLLKQMENEGDNVTPEGLSFETVNDDGFLVFISAEDLADVLERTEMDSVFGPWSVFLFEHFQVSEGFLRLEDIFDNFGEMRIDPKEMGYVRTIINDMPEPA